MKKRLVSLLLSLAILLSLCTGLGMSASAAGKFVKATSLAIGDRVVLVVESESKELSSISTTSTKYGLGEAYSGEPGGIMLLEVCAGKTDGTYAFKTANDKYLYWTSGNSLNVNATLSEKTSWEVSFDSDGNATILNSADPTRQIWWNIKDPRFACYAGKTPTTTGYAQVQLYKATATICDHTTTTYTEPTPPTCTEKGVGRYTCTQCGVSWNVIAKAKGHDYGYAKVNDAVYRNCSGCDFLEPVTMNTIAEAKNYEASGNKGPYNIRGIVTYIKVAAKGTTVYIEDDVDALCVYFTNNDNVSHLRLGYEIFVSDTMTDYNSLPEMKTDSCLVLSANNPLPNKEITIHDILSDTSFEYLGERVTLKDVTIGLVASKGYTPLTDNTVDNGNADDGNGGFFEEDGNESEGSTEDMKGDAIYIYTCPELSSDIDGGDIVNVTGIISCYKEDFQILVNGSTALTDVKKVADGKPMIKETVPISFAKKCTQKGRYFQIEGVVTCIVGRQIFLQDETGGMVVYLALKPTEAPCAVGDKIRVYGLFGNYNGVLELQYVDHTDPQCFEVLSHNHQVIAQPVTIEQLLYDSAIDYELFAEKVFLDDVSILEIEDDGTVLLWQDDYTIEIHEAPALNPDCVLDAVVDVTATVSGYNFDYQLVIMSADQVTFGSQCRHQEVIPVDGVAPGCNEYGYSGDLYCTLCGAFVSMGQVIPPTHLETKVVGEVLPTCTTDGFSGDVYCAICGVLLEKGKTVPMGHTMITENDVDPTCEEDGYSGDEYCSECGLRGKTGEVLPALGHDYDILRIVIEPTCNEPGLAVYICDHCQVSYEAEVPPAGHNGIYTDHGETHGFICFECGESGEEEHEYFEGFCLYCEAKEPERIPIDEAIQIKHTLNLASDISINFAVAQSQLAQYDMFYLECVRDTYTGNESIGSESIILDAPTLKNGYYYFTLTGINATQMNDEVSATLYMLKGDKIYSSNEDIYGVATYAYSQLNKSNAGEALKKVCADLLRYGSAAQIYKKYRVDELTDAAMTDVHKSYLTDLETVVFGKNSINHADLTSPTITWEGKALVMDSKIVLRFIFGTSKYTGNIDNLTLRVSYTDNAGKQVNETVSNPTVYRMANGWYAFDFDGLLAAELRTVVSVAVYNGNTRVSETFSYSADTYGNGKTGDLLTVSKAMLAYSDAACAYFYK